jgi:hypothetical protein
MTDVHPKFASLPQVEAVTYAPGDGGTHRFVLQTAKGSDLRESVFRLAVREGWVVLELSRRVTSLEEVFHRLTRIEETAA